MTEIPSDEHFLKWVPLGPHKKNQHPHGEICIDCWIEDYYEPADNVDDSASHKSGKSFLKNLKGLAGRSPESNRKNLSPFVDRRESNSSLGMTSIKGSVSVEDLSSGKKSSPLSSATRKFNKKDASLLAPAAYTNMRKSVSTYALNSNNTSKTPSPPPTPQDEDISSSAGSGAPGGNNMASIRRNSINDIVAASNAGGVAASLPTIKEQCYPPKVQSIVPTSGSANGGTLIQITGKYLGNSKEDITRLMVAGCNCLFNIEYYSSSKIMCTTSESLGTGPITISTRSGGMSSSKVMFEFVEGKKDKPQESNNNTGGFCSLLLCERFIQCVLPPFPL